MSLNLYLSDLNKSDAIDDQGTFTGTNTAALSGTNATLYYQAPLADWQRIFKFYTDGGADITNEGVTLFTEQAYDIIGDTSASSSSASVGSLYAANAATSATYTANVVNDISSSAGNTTDPAAALDFTKELARAVFGSTESVDMFTNESTIATSYGTAIETCATAIATEFSSASSKTVYGSISSGANLLTAKRIYDQLRYNASGYGTPLTRFTMGYGAAFKSGTSEFTEANDLPVTNGASQSGSPTVDVLMTGTTINAITVNTTGGGFVKGDTIYITNGSNVIEISSLTDVQAKMLNGTLDHSDGTEFPLLANDIFHIQLTITSHSSQTDAAGNVLDTIGDTVSRTADLTIKLVA